MALWFALHIVQPFIKSYGNCVILRIFKILLEVHNSILSCSFDVVTIREMIAHLYSAASSYKMESNFETRQRPLLKDSQAFGKVFFREIMIISRSRYTFQIKILSKCFRKNLNCFWVEKFLGNVFCWLRWVRIVPSPKAKQKFTAG